MLASASLHNIAQSWVEHDGNASASEDEDVKSERGENFELGQSWSEEMNQTEG